MELKGNPKVLLSRDGLTQFYYSRKKAQALFNPKAVGGYVLGIFEPGVEPPPTGSRDFLRGLGFDPNKVRFAGSDYYGGGMKTAKEEAERNHSRWMERAKRFDTLPSRA
jgi:hypothetical protein